MIGRLTIAITAATDTPVTRPRDPSRAAIAPGVSLVIPPSAPMIPARPRYPHASSAPTSIATFPTLAAATNGSENTTAAQIAPIQIEVRGASAMRPARKAIVDSTTNGTRPRLVRTSRTGIAVGGYRKTWPADADRPYGPASCAGAYIEPPDSQRVAPSR